MAGVNERVVGKCSICGGEVTIPTVFYSLAIKSAKRYTKSRKDVARIEVGFVGG